ncbi:hypothetical protein P7K49_005599 [Saguinus oedipus]|uniref:Uncharacterized protein n=1 Tax=Saguinus oedipus TaxID=9490 RepID=A0ABQ9W006_SAGOE|nr:hypothetical protein P7K49_005599 [Saguinus oedipus]
MRPITDAGGSQPTRVQGHEAVSQMVTGGDSAPSLLEVRPTEHAAQVLGLGKPRASVLWSCPGIVHSLGGGLESGQHPPPYERLRALVPTFGFSGISQAEHHRTQTGYSMLSLPVSGVVRTAWGFLGQEAGEEALKTWSRDCSPLPFAIQTPDARTLCQAPDAPRAA